MTVELHKYFQWYVTRNNNIFYCFILPISCLNFCFFSLFLQTGGKVSNDGAQAQVAEDKPSAHFALQEPTRHGLTDELPAIDKENYSEEKLNLSFTQLLTGPISEDLFATNLF